MKRAGRRIIPRGLQCFKPLRAGDATVRDVLNGRTIVDSQRVDADHVRVTVDAPDQTSLDACIDALRQNGISIATVARRQLTLEQAFLELVLGDNKPQ